MNLSEQTLPSPILLYDVNVQPLNVKKRRNEQKLTAKHKEAAERLQKLYDLEQSLINTRRDHTDVVNQLESQLKIVIQNLEAERNDNLRNRELERHETACKSLATKFNLCLWPYDL